MRTARLRAAAVLDRNIEAFAPLGYTEVERRRPLEALVRGRSPELVVRMAPSGRIFGGTFALEVATAEPVMPATPRGLSVRGRGLVHMTGFSVRARGRDAASGQLARRLEDDGVVAEALRRVHFEQIWVEPNGRAVIRHMGGSLVWILFPPLVRPIPLVAAQAAATADALATLAERFPAHSSPARR